MADIRKLASIKHDDEVDFLELIKLFWDGKWIIAGAILIASVLAVILALWLPNIYRAEALLAPVNANQKNDLAATAAQFGGLASLAGINIPDNSDDKITLAIETLKSRKFISGFIQRHDILVPLMASTRWNIKTGVLTIDDDLYDTKKKKWVRDVDLPKLPEPSMQEAYEVFLDTFAVTRDTDTGYLRVSIEHHSPILAKQWVDWLVEDINQTIKANDVLLANQSIEYLNAQIARTPLSEMRNMLFRLIEEQTKTVMLANILPEYVFSTVDPAVVADKEAKPNRLLICIIGSVLGAAIGMLILLIRRSMVSAED